MSVRTALSVLVLGLVLGCTSPEARLGNLPERGGPAVWATVTSVTDGDTVEVDFGSGATERVRLLGIDTPETVRPGHPVDCWGPEASARTTELLPVGSEVLVQRDQEARDRYGRLLLYVWRDDGLFVNQVLVEEGHARTMFFAPNHARRAELTAAAATARAAGRGLWVHCPDEG